MIGLLLGVNSEVRRHVQSHNMLSMPGVVEDEGPKRRPLLELCMLMRLPPAALSGDQRPTAL
jgi:hypothetical protein